MIIWLYLVTVFIAPQLWLEPFIGIRVDTVIYPLWFGILILNNRLSEVFKFKTIDKVYILYIIWIILSITFNEKTIASSTILFNYVKWFFMYRMLVATIHDIEGFRKAISGLILIIAFLVIEGILHKNSLDGIGLAGQSLGWVDPSVILKGGTGRTIWVNIFDGPGSFCVAYTMCLPFVLRYFDSQYSLSKKILALFLLLPLLLAIWYTGSRGGFLSTLSIIASYSMIRLGVDFKKTIMLFSLLMTVYMLAPSHLTSTRDSNKSAQHRVDMWIEGIDMVRDNPLFGVGRGNYVIYTGKLIAHNSAIQIMGELGMPGLILWVMLLYLAFKNIKIYKSSVDDPNSISLANALNICLIGYIVSSMFVTLEYEILYFLIGLTSVLGNIQNKEIKIDHREIVMISGVCIVFVVVLKIFVNLYY